MKFTLEIELGNEAMQTGMQLAGMLQGLSGRIRKEFWATETIDSMHIGTLHDLNGNTVGKWQVSA